ncbi:hypothetical protein FB451DRAFT_1212217 [Mycena latifolia]|nr:hypothetical protein FB451DRAFT_1212217 [Mycena latifolia]
MPVPAANSQTRQLQWPDTREKMKFARGRALRAALELNPLTTSYGVILHDFSEDSVGLDTLKKIRTKVLKTMHEPLEFVCSSLPPAPDLELKLAVLRRYIRDRALHVDDGRHHKPFWPKLDNWYQMKARELGYDFREPLWQRFLDDTFDVEYDLFSSSSIERPLLTSMPMSFSPSGGRPLLTSMPTSIAGVVPEILRDSASLDNGDQGEVLPARHNYIFAIKPSSGSS